jgi:hypothetical protein
VADLLECLVQIRALKETARRLDALLGRFPFPLWMRRSAAGVWSASETVAHLSDAELFFGTRLRLILTVERPRLVAFYADWPPLLALSRFRTRREESLELLERCSAADLERVGVGTEHGVTTVADLVATTLAHDTDHLGEIREQLELAAAAAREGES